VRTSNGQYASIAPGLAASCRNGAAAGGGSTAERQDAFDTFCGVMTNGQDYSYRCGVTDFYSGGRKVPSELRYPDQTIQLTWQSGSRVGLQFEGMVPKEARYSTSEGETNWSSRARLTTASRTRAAPSRSSRTSATDRAASGTGQADPRTRLRCVDNREAASMKCVLWMFAGLYGAAFLLFLIGTYGWFGQEKGPLAGVSRHGILAAQPRSAPILASFSIAGALPVSGFPRASRRRPAGTQMQSVPCD